VDSMAPPQDLKSEMDPDWNIVIIKECIPVPAEGVTKIKVTAADGSNAKDCFEGGEFETFLGRFTIKGNTKASFWSNMELTVIGLLTPQQIKLLPRTLATAKEDDQLSVLNHSTEIPELATNALKKAYISAMKVLTDVQDFDIHTTDLDVIILRRRSLRSTTNYWYQWVINAFQGERRSDFDPDTYFLNPPSPPVILDGEDCDLGGSDTGFLSRSWGWNLAFLFLEVIRDKNVVQRHNGESLRDYGLLFAHEIGHNGRDDRVHIEDGIMNEEGKSIMNGKKMDYYDDDTILKSRKGNVW